MDVFARLAAMFGTGAATVELAVATPQVFRDGTVSGELILHGGRVSQKVRTLSVDLYEYWISGHGKNRTYNQRRHQRVTLAEYLTVDPNMERTFPFELQMPSDARCTRRREGWEVRAEAHIPWSVDARASMPLRVLPHPEVLAIQRCARDLIGLQPIEWDGRGPVVMYNFRAPNSLRGLLDGVRFQHQVAGDAVECHLDLNKQEHGISGALGSLIGADHDEVVVTIPRTELVTKRGTPNPAGAYDHLKVIFERLGAVVPPMPTR